MYSLATLKDDFTASIVVFLVAIPLCLGIALASGAPLFSGLLAGVIGGIVVGSLSASEVSISGPAAGLLAIVLAAIAELGGFREILLSIVLAGILQILIGTLRIGFIADYIPSNVIHGLLAAIGILIVIKQLPLAFGYDKQAETLLNTLQAAQGKLTLTPLLHLFSHVHIGATLISIIALLLLIFWQKLPIGQLKKIPAPIIVVLLGVFINFGYQAFWPAQTLTHQRLVNIPAASSIDGFISLFQFPNFAMWLNPKVYLYAFLFTIIASIETLLNLEAAEKLDKQRRYCSRNREMVAQGIGNALSGLIGGLPITSVIVRTSVNIEAGSKTKLSAVLHGLLILIAIIAIPDWMNAIPLAALAAILIHTGYKLSSASLYRTMYEKGFENFIPFLVTIIGILATNLFLGILIGLGVSFFYILKYNSKTRFDIYDEKYPGGEVLRIMLPQQVSFLSKASLLTELRTLPQNSRVVIDANYAEYIDQDILELIDEFREYKAPRKNITLHLQGFKSHYAVHDHIDFINVTSAHTQNKLTPTDIVLLLKEGNKRFLNNTRINRYFPDQIKASAAAQHPIAAVLGCIDSRVPAETIFDLGIGDIFSVRVAGNVINPDVLGSLEFACDIAGAKVIVVLGHTNCGAIQAAYEGAAPGHLQGLVEKIIPAIDVAKQRTHNTEDLMKNITVQNIHLAKQHILEQSEILHTLNADKKIVVVGALYDVTTGQVKFESP